MLVENSDNYTLTAIRREAAGEYKCSLADNENMVDSQSIDISCEYSWHMQSLSILEHNNCPHVAFASNQHMAAPPFHLEFFNVL